jgi:hypothetical protein
MKFGLEVRQVKCVGVESELVCLFKCSMVRCEVGPSRYC